MKRLQSVSLDQWTHTCFEGKTDVSHLPFKMLHVNDEKTKIKYNYNIYKINIILLIM